MHLLDPLQLQLTLQMKSAHYAHQSEPTNVGALDESLLLVAEHLARTKALLEALLSGAESRKLKFE